MAHINASRPSPTTDRGQAPKKQEEHMMKRTMTMIVALALCLVSLIAFADGYTIGIRSHVGKVQQTDIMKTSNVLADPAPAVFMVNYGSSSIEYTVRCWANVADYWDVYFQLTETLRETFAAHNVEMTYDHLNVHVVEK